MSSVEVVLGNSRRQILVVMANRTTAMLAGRGLAKLKGLMADRTIAWLAGRGLAKLEKGLPVFLNVPIFVCEMRLKEGREKEGYMKIDQR